MKYTKRVIPILAALFAVGVGTYFYYVDDLNEDAVSPVVSLKPEHTATAEPTTDPLLPSDLSSILDTTETLPLDTVPSSYTVLVNRDYLLPADYVPTDLTEPDVRFSHGDHDDKRKLRKVAAAALEKMFRAAEKKNLILYGVSGYRSYQRQDSIYRRNVALHGKAATDALSALPGSSEHQTGLTIDISCRSVNGLLTQRLADTGEGKWVIKNAHKYGYIIRYPQGKTKITGYSYEPWHIRYVGVTIATYLYKNKLTLEEFYGVSNKSSTKEGVDVDDLGNYETDYPPKGTPSPTPANSSRETSPQ